MRPLRREIAQEHERRRRTAPHGTTSVAGEPKQFANLFRHDDASRLILQGLQDHYFQCLASGRLDVWAKAAHAAIDLLATPDDVVIHKR